MRCRAHRELLAVRVELGAEAATHVGGDDADLRLGRPADDADECADEVRNLRRRVQRDLTGRLLPVADAPAGLHRRRREALVVDAQLDHLRGLRHGVVEAVGDVLERLHEIAVVLGVHERRAGLKGLLGIDHDREGVVLDVHEVGTITSQVAVVGDHHRDGLADVAGDLLGEDGLLGMTDVATRVRRAEHASLDRQRLVGQHRMNARQRECSSSVDRRDPRVAEGRAHERGVQHGGQLEVIHVAAFAGDELAVFLAQNRIADAARGLGRVVDGHDQLLAIWSAAARMLATMFW